MGGGLAVVARHLVLVHLHPLHVFDVVREAAAALLRLSTAPQPPTTHTPGITPHPYKGITTGGGKSNEQNPHMVCALAKSAQLSVQPAQSLAGRRRRALSTLALRVRLRRHQPPNP